MTDGAVHVGFIGLGHMGHGMAVNILKRGFRLHVMAHRNRKAVDDLIHRGAQEVPTAKALAASCDIVLLCVPGAKEVEALVTGDDGLAAGSRAGLTVVDCTDLRSFHVAALGRRIRATWPCVCRRAARALAERGVARRALDHGRWRAFDARADPPCSCSLRNDHPTRGGAWKWPSTQAGQQSAYRSATPRFTRRRSRSPSNPGSTPRPSTFSCARAACTARSMIRSSAGSSQAIVKAIRTRSTTLCARFPTSFNFRGRFA